MRIVCTDRACLNAKPIVALITLPNCDEVIKTFWNNDFETTAIEGNETYNGTSMTFEVHIHSDQGEGYDWIEDWCIDEYGRIYSEDDIYESYEEFLREWV